MNKRLTALLLSVLMILTLSLTACSGKTSDPDPTEDSTTATTVADTTVTTVATEAETTVPTTAEATTEAQSDDVNGGPVDNDGGNSGSDITKVPCVITVGDKDYTVNTGDVVTYAMTLTTPKAIENVQATLSYDGMTLKLMEASSKSMFPVLGDSCVYNTGLSNKLKFNASMVSGYDFTDGGQLVTVSFKVLKGGNTTIATALEVMDAKGGEAYVDNYTIIGDITLSETLAQ